MSNKVIITKCKDCAAWVPVDSHGFGVYCDELGQVISEADTDVGIPDNCPKLTSSEELKNV